jgi:hypothetical protein
LSETKIILTDKLDDRLHELIKQWGIAERRIKQAENARAQEIVSSAIYELRYSGRKIVDAIQLALTTDWRNDEGAAEQIHAYIDDAIEDCIKAKHDAIDATMSFVIRWFSEQEQVIGLRHIQTFFPRYLEITSKISDIQEKIEESRGDRTRLREMIYDDIEKNGYDEILKLYKEMKASRERVARVIRYEKLKDRALWFFGGIGVVALIGEIVHLWLVLH